GAADDTVAIGLADTYIAQGKDREAAKVLSSLGNPSDYQQSYDYELAWGNIYSQQHDSLRALSAFARANQIASGDDVAERSMLQVSDQEGTIIRPSLGLRSDFATGAVFEDATIYEMDTKFIGSPVAPRSSQETDFGTMFRYHREGWLPINFYTGL